MFKLYNINKIKLMSAFLSFTKYTAWCGFFIFQGRAIQQAINKNTLFEQLLLTLVWFVLTKLIVMFSDLTNKFLACYYENKEIAEQWKLQFPKKIYHDNEQKHNLIYLFYFDHLPNLYNLECAIINNQCTIMIVLVMVVSLLIYTQFFYGIFALIALFYLNYLSKNIFLKRLDYHQDRIHDNKRSILTWINEYFKSYREISFNWVEQIHLWRKSAYYPLYESKNNFILAQLLRDIMAQIMVELPFIINTLLVIVAVYFNHLSITNMFVWVGFSQLIINASNAFLENNANQCKKRILIKAINEIASSFKIKDKNIVLNKSHLNEDLIQVKLQDNTINELSIKPGIYHIKGSNGSGKTTLLNSILGYEREVQVHNQSDLKQMLANIPKTKIRVVERDPVIFKSLKTFNEQILGPINPNYSDWQIALDEKMRGRLSTHLINAFLALFLKIEEKFYERRNGQFSSGEKILISLLRSLSSWDRTVSILVIDECTAFLDTQIKDLFLRCLSELSAITAVYLSTHEEVNLAKPVKVNLEIIR